MQSRIVKAGLSLALVCCTALTGAWAGQAELDGVIKSLRGIPVEDKADYILAEGGYLRFIGAPPGSAFKPTTAAKAILAEDTARAYLAEHMRAFGSQSSRQGFERDFVRTSNGRSYVRLQQTYADIPVFGAQINVQVNADGTIQNILSDIMRNTRLLDEGAVSMSPRLTAAQAGQKAVEWVAIGYPLKALSTSGTPELLVYDPSVIGNAGPPALVWSVTVGTPESWDVRLKVFIDAQSGEPLFRYSLVHDVRFRRIYDLYGAFDSHGFVRRQEGQTPVGIKDVDLAYDYLGDTYDYYMSEHGRDGIDGYGMQMNATVRLNDSNAYWNGDEGWMYFGTDWAVDDVAGHELTHGVTQWSSGLIYANESGAINEAFSDIWGEFIDLSNGKGNDTPAVRWLVGEDLPYNPEEEPNGAIRDMKNPSRLGAYIPVMDVDYWWWYGYRYVRYPEKYSDYVDASWYDEGGVHINSSIANKMAYLLTDGGTFNGQTVKGIGISKAADVLYEAQLNLITAAADFYDLGLQMVQAAYNLDYTREEINDVKAATRAVEIAPREAPHGLRFFRAISPAGERLVRLLWENPNYGTTGPITLIRRTDRFAYGPTDVQLGSEWSQVVAGVSHEDEDVVSGREYFYSGFIGNGGAQQAAHARVTVGQGDPDYLSQAFAKHVGRPVDLAYSQITFDPMFDFTDAYESGQPRGYANYDTYIVTVEKGVDNLEVDREGAVYFRLLEDGIQPFSTSAPVPLFGRFISNFGLSPNGYIADLGDVVDLMARVSPGDFMYSYLGDFNYPSSQSHFLFPKIAFLFSDLSPASGGTTWYKDLPDRFVITFEKVPEFGAFRGNTVQLEMFYSGRIRITLLEINADTAVIGISDGNGIPFDAATDRVKQSDLSGLPASLPDKMTLNPLVPVEAGELEEINFTMSANPPAGAAEPKFTFMRVAGTGLPMELPAGVTVTPPSGAGTRSATFRWTPTLEQGGHYVFRAVFETGGQAVSQDIQVVAGNTDVKPILTDLPRILPINPQDSNMLRVEYDYSHVEAAPEGATEIRWLKNGALVATLTNRREVPSIMTNPGEQWRVLVRPITVSGIEGDVYQSEIITIGPDIQPDINKDGAINAVDVQLVVNGALGLGSRAMDADVDGDYRVNAMDVQLVVNTLVSRP